MIMTWFGSGWPSALRATSRPGIRLVAEARTTAELERVLSGQVCDVVVLDLALGDGSDPAKTVRDLVDRGYRVLIYSIADDPRLVGRALAAGAHGLSRKSEPIEVTLEKIRLVADGHVLLSQEILAVIDADAGFVEAKLSQREREVLVLYVSGPRGAADRPPTLHHREQRQGVPAAHSCQVRRGRPARPEQGRSPPARNRGRDRAADPAPLSPRIQLRTLVSCVPAASIVS